MSISQPILTHKNDMKGSMGQIYIYSTRLLGNIVLVLRINWALAIIIIFFDHQDTESESWETEIGVSGPIFTHKNQRLYRTTISILCKIGE